MSIRTDLHTTPYGVDMSFNLKDHTFISRYQKEIRWKNFPTKFSSIHILE